MTLFDIAKGLVGIDDLLGPNEELFESLIDTPQRHDGYDRAHIVGHRRMFDESYFIWYCTEVILENGN